jgi:hypothetical protein
LSEGDMQVTHLIISAKSLDEKVIRQQPVNGKMIAWFLNLTEIIIADSASLFFVKFLLAIVIIVF